MNAKVKPIRSKRDYESALKEVDRLWGAKAGTRDGDRLDGFNIDLVELLADCGAGAVPIGLIGRNERGDAYQPGIGEQRRHLANPANVFGAVLG